MVGIFAFLTQLVFLLLPFLVVWAAINDWRKNKGVRNILGSLFFVLIGGYFLLCTLYQLIYQVKLRALTTQEVEWVEIGSKHISDEKELSEIVAALNEVKWFFPASGGWNPNLSLSIKKKNGEQENYDLAIYSSEGGTILKGNRITFYCGFSRRLPKTLEEIGIPLPEKQK
jgi:hypothetical protein